MSRGLLFQVRSHPSDPPRGRAALIVFDVIGREPGERLTQGRTQREQRDSPPYLVSRAGGEGEAEGRRFVDGPAHQRGLAYPGFSLGQHHAAAAASRHALQEVKNPPLLILAPAHSPRRKTVDYRDHGVNVITGLARLNCRACADIG